MITLYAMPFLREIRDMLLFAHSDNLISEEDVIKLRKKLVNQMKSALNSSVIKR